MHDTHDALAPISKGANATLRPDGLGDFSRTRDGMVWIGGRIELGDARLTFSANRLNRWINPLVLGKLDPMVMDFGVSLDSPFKMRVHSTFVTQTIELKLADGMQIGIRCWGAAKLAAEIAARRDRLRPEGGAR